MKYCRKEDDVFYHTVMTKTKTNTKTKTKCIEDPTYAIFSKSREFKDTDAEYKDKYIDIYKDKDKDKDKYKVHRRPNICYIFEKQGVQGYQI